MRLYEDKKVTLQLCGSDQWGNSIAGVDLIRRKFGVEAHVFSTSLIIDASSGQKFGKSEAGAIWLDSSKTTIFQFYQFWLNIDDQIVESFLKIYTELDQKMIKNIMHDFNLNQGGRQAQKTLAFEVTKLVHGRENAIKQVNIAEAIASQDLSKLSDSEINTIREEIVNIKTTLTGSIVDLLVNSGLATSNTEARRLIKENAIAINGHKIARDKLQPTDFIKGRLLLRRGKTFKDSALVEHE